MFKCSRSVLAACLVWLTAASAQADIIFNVSFLDVVNSTGVGFDDPTLGSTRRDTFSSVFTYLNTVLDETGTVDFEVGVSETDGTGSLASGGTLFPTTGELFFNGALFNRVDTGVDISGAEGIASFDFGYNWNSDLDSPTGSEYDLFSVTLHEVAHALGILGTIESTGVSSLSGGDPGVFSVFASFLQRGDGTPLFAAGGDYLGTAADLVSDDVFFGGANATAANGGTPVEIYAPGAFAPGSSISHIVFPDAVMQFAIGLGDERRSFNSVEVGILQDIGWTVASASSSAAVPEPGTMAFAVVGLAGVGVLSRRRRRKANG